VVVARNVPSQLVNVQGLFNLVCLYGNVEKIRFVLTKPGMALISMEDPAAALLVVSALNGIVLFGQKLDLMISKHAEVKESARQDMMPDGTPVCVPTHSTHTLC
jgi:heterogeneous nuclear ribonucleoprotein L